MSNLEASHPHSQLPDCTAKVLVRNKDKSIKQIEENRNNDCLGLKTIFYSILFYLHFLSYD